MNGTYLLRSLSLNREAFYNIRLQNYLTLKVKKVNAGPMKNKNYLPR